MTLHVRNDDRQLSPISVSSSLNIITHYDIFVDRAGFEPVVIEP